MQEYVNMAQFPDMGRDLSLEDIVEQLKKVEWMLNAVVNLQYTRKLILRIYINGVDVDDPDHYCTHVKLLYHEPGTIRDCKRLADWHANGLCQIDWSGINDRVDYYKEHYA